MVAKFRGIYPPYPLLFNTFFKSNIFIKGYIYMDIIKNTRLKIGFCNLQKIHPSLNQDDPFALAYMSLNPTITDEERKMLLEILKEKCKEGIIL